jgi:UDP:flavonoid glycosyltransferase YjiC (YdhE family)
MKQSAANGNGSQQPASELRPLIGIVTVGIASYLNPLLELAVRLGEAGYRVSFVSTNELVEKAARGAGHDFHLLCSAIPEAEASIEQDLRQSPGWRRSIGLASRRTVARAYNQSFRQGQGLQDFLDRQAPVAVMVMAEMHEAIVFLAGHGVPVIVTDTHLATRRRPGLPPPHSKHVPRAMRPSKIRSVIAWKAFNIRRWLARTLHRFELGQQERFTALHRLADSLNLSSRDFLDMRQWHFVDYPTLPTLRLAAPELDFINGPEPGVAYTGVLTGTDRVALGGNETGDAWRDFIQAQAASGLPLVFCSLGSFKSRGGFLKRVIDASADQQWRLLVATGPECDPEELGQLPKNVAVFSWLPQPEILAQADVMLCAGGNATINECVVSGVPMLVYPIDRMDQYGMSARVVYHGLGLRGSLESDDVSTIRQNLKRLLADREIRRQVGVMQDRILRYARSERPEQAIRQALDKSVSSRSSPG